MNTQNSVITLTFGDSAENHVGMEKLGSMVKEGQGFQVGELQKLCVNLETQLGIECEFFHLNREKEYPLASVLVLRNGVDAILNQIGKTKEDLFREQASLNVDKKAMMYGRVVNKNARWNLCFDEKGHEPEYEKGKGRVVAYQDIPITKYLKESLPRYFGNKAESLKCEANYYYDVKKCGIGFHGDSERRKVIGVRLGASMDLYFSWFKDGDPVGERFCIPLHGGDMYVMSEKAVGTDWKWKSMYTLRHATGCKVFTSLV